MWRRECQAIDKGQGGQERRDINQNPEGEERIN